MSGLYNTVQTEAGMVIFAITNIILYFSSGFYHYLKPGNGKRVCRILDHMNIYILIAGSYTPVLLYINTRIAMTILAVMWSLVIVGTLLTVLFWGRMRAAHVALYILMGWLCIFFAGDIFPLLPPGLFKWILAGGIIYTAGVLFYAVKRIPHHHFIWHIFTLLGSLSFYVGYVIYLR